MELKVGDVPVAVRRKAIKHMHLYVEPPDGSILVSAPKEASDEEVLFFVRENFGWVLRQRNGMLAQRRQPPRKYISGETHYLWGEQYFLELVKQDGWGGIKISGNALTMLAPLESTEKSRRDYMTEWERSLLSDAVNRALPLWEKRTGLNVQRFSIMNMRRSWGKCNPKKESVIFNLQLVRKPKEALDYIILHELCHLKTRTHGKEFIALMDRFMPDWREVRKRLNDSPLDYVSGEKAKDGEAT